MVEQIIHWSVQNRLMTLMLTAGLVVWGLLALQRTPLDAIPDLSDVQVIIKTSYPGQAPQVVEDQVTYPLTTALLAVPRAETVRGYSFFGDSYVYVIFADGTDLYWARSRVLEYLNQVSGQLPAGVTPTLGPDATGVGWVFQYALVDRSGSHDLAQLRTLQDWFLKYELQTVEGVAEVATIGGMVKQYQVVVDPHKLRAYNLPLAQVREAIRQGNQETGGSVIEMAEAEYMIRASGYLQSLDDLRQIPLKVSATGTPLLLGDVAEIRLGPQLRRGIGELNGEGEAVGGVIVMRYGENAMTTIAAVKEKLASLKAGLPAGVELVVTYDRSDLIQRAVDNLLDKLLEEFIVVALVCALFLFHLPSALVILISLPIGILCAFIVMQSQGINANIMSLGGIAIAVGTMVDAAIVVIENFHKRIEREPLTAENRWRLVAESCCEVGRPLFFALLIITLSFVPVFALEAQEGKLFKPLAFTKTYAMAAAAALAITLIPVLLGYLVRGRVLAERRNPLNRLLMLLYRPFLNAALRAPWVIVLLALGVMASAWWPLQRLGTEFMPDLNEGDLLYMPSAYPAVSVGKMQEILQQTNRLISTLPEVETVYGKAGRAETATDPAPLTMVETTIKLKPPSEWRPGVTIESLRQELDRLVQIPSLTNVWIMPIKNRIDMLATGIKTPVGIKVSGPDLDTIAEVTTRIERVVQQLPGAASVYAERVTGGRFVDIDIDRRAAARFGLNINDIHDIVRTAIGGMTVAQSVEGLERYPINLRYPQAWRDSVQQLQQLPIVTPNGAHIPLATVATVKISDGPGMIRSENARRNGWIYVDIAGRDLGSFVAEAKRAVAEEVELPTGYAVGWSGQYEYMERAQARLAIVIPATLAIIFMLLYLSFGRMAEVIIILTTLPFGLVGGLWLLAGLGFNLSVAVGVGFIALAGVAVELGVLMLAYLNQALVEERRRCAEAGRAFDPAALRNAVVAGSLLRVRPITMTVATIVAGLWPIMTSDATGSEVMQRIAAPMFGGILSALALTLVVLPAVFYLWQRAALKRQTVEEKASPLPALP